MISRLWPRVCSTASKYSALDVMMPAKQRKPQWRACVRCLIYTRGRGSLVCLEEWHCQIYQGALLRLLSTCRCSAAVGGAVLFPWRGPNSILFSFCLNILRSPSGKCSPLPPLSTKLRFVPLKWGTPERTYIMRRERSINVLATCGEMGAHKWMTHFFSSHIYEPIKCFAISHYSAFPLLSERPLT